ncbi:MAG: hypothetical protein R3F43_32320, partial [bacterium]
LALPVGETQVDGLVWFGEVLGLVAAGYPNWVVQLSLPGPSVWQVQRFGTIPHPLATAVVRRGLVVAWPDRLGPAGVAVLGEDGSVVRAPGPIPIEGATALAIVPAGEHVAVAWVARGEAGPTLHTALLDPVAGELTHGPYDLGPGHAIDLVGNGEDGFAVLLHTDDGLWLTRLSSLGEPAFAPVRVAGPVDAAAVQGNYYIEELPVVFSRDGVLTLQRYSRLGVPLGDAVALGDLAASAIKLLRVDRTYGLFVVADGVLYGAGASAGVGAWRGPWRPWRGTSASCTPGAASTTTWPGGGAGVRFLGGPAEAPEP